MKLFLTLFLFCTVFTSAIAQNSTQPLRRSNVLVKATSSEGNTLEATVGEATVYYTASSGDILIGFDVNNFSTGDTLIDAIAIQSGDAIMEFNGNVGMSLFSLNEAKNDGKTYTMNGKFKFNNRDTLITAIFDPISFSGGGFDGADSDLRLNFKFILDPTKFYLPGYAERGYTALTFEVAPGLINSR